MSLGIVGCERSGFPALCALGRKEPEIWNRITDVFPVPCLGMVDEERILELLARYDVLLLVGCPPSSCRSDWGSTLAEKRVERISRLLEEAEVPKRVLCVFANLKRLGELKARVFS